jgi:CRP-like cAMP-binding protein
MPPQPTHTASQTVAAIPAASTTLLARLPRDVQHRLLSLCTRVALEKDALLSEAGAPARWAYLPCTGLVSLQTMTQDAETVEIAMVGNEGVAGLALASSSVAAPHTAVVVISGEAYRLPAETLQSEFEHCIQLQRVLVQYWHQMMIEMAQGSACHRFHSARQRLARWLLSASERTQSSRIDLTQERLAQVLGLQRTGVTVASVALQDAGAIKSRHGRITILDSRRLATSACECWSAGRTQRGERSIVEGSPSSASRRSLPRKCEESG